MLVPVSKADEAAAYLERFARWIAKHPDQAHLFCEHGQYCGATGPGSFIHNCKPCKGDS